jgi:hypothetical protein
MDLLFAVIAGYLAVGLLLTLIAETNTGPMWTTNPRGAVLLILLWPAAAIYYAPQATSIKCWGREVWKKKGPRREAPSMREMREAMRGSNDLPPPFYR